MPTRAGGLEAGVWMTYAGKIARDACMEVAFDGSGGFCMVFYGKLEAYANFFLHRWMHIRKHDGLEQMVDYLTSRVLGPPKSLLFGEYGEVSEIWSRKWPIICL